MRKVLSYVAESGELKAGEGKRKAEREKPKVTERMYKTIAHKKYFGRGFVNAWENSLGRYGVRGKAARGEKGNEGGWIRFLGSAARRVVEEARWQGNRRVVQETAAPLRRA